MPLKGHDFKLDWSLSSKPAHISFIEIVYEAPHENNKFCRRKYFTEGISDFSGPLAQQNITISGKTCQAWNVDTPHERQSLTIRYKNEPASARSVYPFRRWLRNYLRISMCGRFKISAVQIFLLLYLVSSEKVSLVLNFYSTNTLAQIN